MSDTKLPRTLPAGTRLIVLDENGDKRVNDAPVFIHVLTSPVHLLDEGMVEDIIRTGRDFVREVNHANIGDFHIDQRCGEFSRAIAAFAHVINPPQETGKEKTCREKLIDLGDDAPMAFNILADAIDAQQATIEALREELNEARNGR